MHSETHKLSQTAAWRSISSLLVQQSFFRNCEETEHIIAGNEVIALYGSQILSWFTNQLITGLWIEPIPKN